MKRPDVAAASNGNGVPDWMAAFGVKSSEWLSMSKDQLRSQMRPDRPLKVQLWACGILHTAGYKGERAVTKHRDKIVNFTPSVAIRELHDEAVRYYQSAGIVMTEAEKGKLKEEKEDIRSAIEQLELEGVASRKLNGRPIGELPPEERQRLASGKIEYHFFLKPRPAAAEAVQKKWAKLTEPDMSTADVSKVEVGIISLPPAQMCQILKALNFARPAKELLTSPDYQKKFAEAYESARKLFAALEAEVGNKSLPQVGATDLPQVGNGGGAFERKLERKGENGGTPHHRQSVSPPAPETDRPTDEPKDTPPDQEERMRSLIVEACGERFPGVVPGRTLCLQCIQRLGDTDWNEFGRALRSHRWKDQDVIGKARAIAEEVRARWISIAAKKKRAGPKVATKEEAVDALLWLAANDEDPEARKAAKKTLLEEHGIQYGVRKATP